MVGEDRQTHLRLISIFTNIKIIALTIKGTRRGRRSKRLQIKRDLMYYQLNPMSGPFLHPDLNEHVKRNEIIGHFKKLIYFGR